MINCYESYIEVSLKRNEACAKCKACAEGFSEQEMILNAKNDCGAKIGDFVNIEIDMGFAIKATLIMYGIPLIGFLFGIFIFVPFKQYISIDFEILSFFSGIFFTALVFLFIKFFIDKKIKKENYTPVATKIC